MKEVLKEVLDVVKPKPEEKKLIKDLSEKVIDEINSRLRRKGIEAHVFIGGSLAKDTIVKNKIFDADIFLRFNKKYSEEDIRKLFKRIFFLFRIKGERIKLKKLHGSRDYVRVLFKNHSEFEVEVIPVSEINNPNDARNVTDLSYFHVKYIRSKLSKRKKLADDIVLAKAFCYANKCYGAESYIKGFSGYALELLIIHFKGFENFLKELGNQQDRLIIDQEKKYKSTSEILEKMNKSRLDSPIVLVDPTFKERNASVSLSYSTFDIFKIKAKEFLENPSTSFFQEKKLDINYLQKKAYEHDGIFLKIELKTNKQAGDIAGTKLLKFYNLLNRDIVDYFDILGRAFEYHERINTSYIYYAVKRKKERIIEGPKLEFKEAVENFKKKRPVWHIKGNKIYSAKPTDITPKDFINEFTNIHKRTIREMGITKIKIV